MSRAAARAPSSPVVSLTRIDPQDLAYTPSDPNRGGVTINEPELSSVYRRSQGKPSRGGSARGNKSLRSLEHSLFLGSSDTSEKGLFLARSYL
jgi:hypothetical protein